MSKKHPKKVASVEAVAEAEIPAIPEVTPQAFGYNEMLGELEAIVADAEVKQAQDAPLL